MSDQKKSEGQPQVGSTAGLADRCATCVRWQSFDHKTGECHDASKVVWLAGHDMKLVDAPETPNDGWCSNWSSSANEKLSEGAP